MGSDETAVVDPHLLVTGVNRLGIIDASVMPKVTSANTNAATLTIGERGADLTLRDIHGKRNAMRPGERLP